jgi:hypothetical protein
MILPRWLLGFLLVTAGLACGTMAKKIAGLQAHPASAPAAAEDDRAQTTPTYAESPAEISSKDTAESLLTLPAPELYGRLALWLLDADEAEIAAFLQSYRQQGGNDYETTRLLFVNWTRLNPHGAVDAAADDGDRYHIWSAWACHDPAAALDANAAAGGKMSGAVCSAIGHFQLSWMIAHFDRLPADGQQIAIETLRQRIHPYPVTARTLRLAEQWQNAELTAALLALLAAQDPFQAWILMGGSDPDWFARTYLKPYQYGELERISETLPPGKLKDQLDLKALELQARVDPEAALAKARANEEPQMKAQLMAIAGKAFIYSDPEKALQIADELFAACPAIFDIPNVKQPDGTYESDGERHDKMVQVHHFMASISRLDPEELIDAFLSRNPDELPKKTSRHLLGIWSGQAPGSYAQWLNKQTDPRVREPGTRVLVDRLVGQQQYPDALDWAVSLTDPTGNPTEQIFRQWREKDPDAALEWLDSAALPQDRKARLREGGTR